MNLVGRCFCPQYPARPRHVMARKGDRKAGHEKPVLKDSGESKPGRTQELQRTRLPKNTWPANLRNLEKTLRCRVFAAFGKTSSRLNLRGTR